MSLEPRRIVVPLYMSLAQAVTATVTVILYALLDLEKARKRRLEKSQLFEYCVVKLFNLLVPITLFIYQSEILW